MTRDKGTRVTCTSQKRSINQPQQALTTGILTQCAEAPLPPPPPGMVTPRMRVDGRDPRRTLTGAQRGKKLPKWLDNPHLRPLLYMGAYVYATIIILVLMLTTPPMMSCSPRTFL